MIMLTQWSCPNGHCSMAFCWDTKTGTEDEMLGKANRLFESGVVLRLCALCKSTELAPETQQTRFSSMDEAQAGVMATQVAEMLKRALWERMQWSQRN